MSFVLVAAGLSLLGFVGRLRTRRMKLIDK